MSVSIRPKKRNRRAVSKIDEPEQRRSDHVKHSRKPEKCRQYADRNQGATVEDDLPARAPPAPIHRETRASIVLSEDPCDSKKVGHLPKEENREQRERHSVYFAA